MNIEIFSRRYNHRKKNLLGLILNTRFDVLIFGLFLEVMNRNLNCQFAVFIYYFFEDFSSNNKYILLINEINLASFLPVG